VIVASRAAFASSLAEEAASGTKILLLAPLGAGKTHTLRFLLEALRARSIPCVFTDLFTSASTPEHLLETLAESLLPFMEDQAASIRDLVAEGVRDRHRSSQALLRLFELITAGPHQRPFVWLVDEVTEIRSLAYFPELGRIEEPFARALGSARGAILASSYLGLAADLFRAFDRRSLPGLTSADLEAALSTGRDHEDVAAAIAVSGGGAATLLPLATELRVSGDVAGSLARLLRPGGTLELLCRRHYEILLVRSRGYAVAKRAAEVVAGARDQRLTDLFPRIGRTAGASRQYLRWLVEVGLLIQVKKRYDFADPLLGLWAELYLGRTSHPGDDEINAAVAARLVPGPRGSAALNDAPEPVEPPRRRADRFEEFD
jgi:hypothetical protein